MVLWVFLVVLGVFWKTSVFWGKVVVFFLWFGSFKRFFSVFEVFFCRKFCDGKLVAVFREVWFVFSMK